MQKQIYLFVEGGEDCNFLKYFITEKFPQHWQYFQYEIVHSKDKIHEARPELEKIFDKGHTILFVFDADDSPQEAKENILSKIPKNIQVEIFLFPDNQDNGILENLLEKIISQANQEFYENCWKNFCNCLDNLPNKQRDITIKTRIKCYCDVFLVNHQITGQQAKKQMQKNNIDYANQQNWNLNHEFLTPLYDFLDTHLQIFLQNTIKN